MSVNVNEAKHNYKVNQAAFTKGLTRQQLQDYYKEWAPKYETTLAPKFYSGPKFTGEAFAEHVAPDQRSSFRVLDIGAGTGFVGQQLKMKGFVHIDALEPFENMINEAKKKNIYEKFHHTKIGGDPVAIKDDTYDGIISCGSFGENHIPCKALFDMIRVVKPGGIICIGMRERYLHEVEELIDRFVPLLKKLENAGAWKLLKREIKPRFAFEYDGVIYSYVVQIPGTVYIDI